MVEPKYRHPIWLQALWIAILASLFVLKYFMNTDVWGTIATSAFIVLGLLTVGYNKIKTGVWLPGAKTYAPKEEEVRQTKTPPC